MDNLDPIIDRIRTSFDAKNTARDAAVQRSRELIRYCANTIRAVHRQPGDNLSAEDRREARELLAVARSHARQMVTDLAAYPDLLHAGYTQDAIKEYVEASTVYALVAGEPLPDPDELGVAYAAYLNGLAEAASELRRRILDIIRNGHSAEAERLLAAMEDIYGVLVTIDYPDAITGGLRRTTDQLRGVLERTRGDVTSSMRQDKLIEALHEFETRVEGQTSGSGQSPQLHGDRQATGAEGYATAGPEQD
jgi:translin